MSDAVKIIVPCRAEYVSVIRLAILGAASVIKRFSREEIEDIRLAVGEICANAVKRALQNDKTDSELEVESVISDNIIDITISDHSGELSDEARENDSYQISSALIDILMDDVSVKSLSDGTQIRVRKYVG